jgi:transcriptional regulator with XRE-family HTH domain
MMSAKRKREVPGVVTQLRDAIRQSGQSLNAISRMCGVGSDQLSRFMRGERDLTLQTAERICQALHLELMRSIAPAEPPAAEPPPKRRSQK